MLEKMGEFFDHRLEEYDEHQLKCIKGATEFYKFTASCLPKEKSARVLDLGCGTGLELEQYFDVNPSAKVVGIDLAPKMLDTLRGKFPDKKLTLVLGSYFDVPVESNAYDATVSVESLHHFTKEEKIPLYTKIHKALKEEGYFILTDYFSLSEKDEKFYRSELLRIKKQQGISDGEFYHYDTPLTVEHEMEALRAAGFCEVKQLNNWGATYTLKAIK
jgi:tRNA (cmo5U34)-methyltransferase